MKSPSQTPFMLLGAISFSFFPFVFAQHPPSEKERAAESLIVYDENDRPYVADKHKAQVAALAASKEAPEDLRFDAIQGLGLSGYSPESAEGLILAVEDQSLSEIVRGYAAMGLGNFSNLPPQSKEELRRRLKISVESDSDKVPDSAFRLLIRWGEASWIAERLGEKFYGHRMEIEILQKLEPKVSTPRLLDLYHAIPVENSKESYSQRAKIGYAFLKLKDRRGIDILEALLDADQVPQIDGKLAHVYRKNVFHGITREVRDDFGFQQLHYDPSIDKAIRRFRYWWLENRYTFTFSDDSGMPLDWYMNLMQNNKTSDSDADQKR